MNWTVVDRGVLKGSVMEEGLDQVMRGQGGVLSGHFGIFV